MIERILMNETAFRKDVLLFSILHALIFLCLFAPVAISFYHGTGTLELYYAKRMLSGEVPYRDFATEYPPLALLSFILPGLFFRTTAAYSFAFAAELLIFDLFIIFFIADISRCLKYPVRTTLAIFTTAVIATGAITVCRYDILPAMLTTMALWAFIRGKNRLCWAALALGFATKIYPVLLAPLLFVHQLKQKQYRKLASGIATFLAVTVLISLPWLVIDAEGYGHSFTYHLSRELHAESSYGTALLAAQVLGLTEVQGKLTYGSWNLFSPLADRLAGASFYVLVILLLALYATAYFRRGENAPMAFLRHANLAVLIFLLANKVFSAQYLVWLCPLIPLLALDGQYTISIIFAVACAITQYVYPYAYADFELAKPLPVFLLFIRNLLLFVTAIMIALSRRHPAQAQISEDPHS
ncbi:MAG: glycosyltransferase 87 family protein [Dehalococcoidales bacterium]|nr:glycosyltransferase 87 family protein [Dehalococcoidales bacterium]